MTKRMFKHVSRFWVQVGKVKNLVGGGCGWWIPGPLETGHPANV
jgi:hypothetical protein